MGEARWSRAAGVIAGRLARRFGSGPQSIDLTVNLGLARK
jgi:hypothetical protein